MTQPWSRMQTHFARQPSLHGMLTLVNQIIASPYVEGLFPWQSHWDLCLTQTPVEYPYNGPRLRISPLTSEKIEFRYIDTEIVEKQWRRYVDAEHAFARLESFLQQLHWFTRVEADLK